MEKKQWAAGWCIGAALALTAGPLAAQTEPAAAAPPTAATAQVAPAKDDLAEQVRSLRDLVFKQQEEINQLKGLPKSGEPTMTAEDQRLLILQTIREEMKSQPALPDWVANTTISGDFRYRTEYIKQAQSTQDRINWNTPLNKKTTAAQQAAYATRLTGDRPEETRQRIRARLGVFTKVNDEADVGIQFATGENADPVSTNQTLGGGGYPSFEKTPVWFDLAYGDYHPKWLPDTHIIMGRIVNPFYKAPTSELIWDDDLRFDGMALKWNKKVGDQLLVFANGGGFWVNERNRAVDSATAGVPSSADTGLWGAQGGATLSAPQLAKGAYVTAALAYYGYSNVDGYPASTFYTGTGDGNTVSMNSMAGNNVLSYYDDYQIINPIIEVGVDDPWWHRPIKVFTEMASNVASSSKDNGKIPNNAQSQRGNIDNDFAYLIGATYGQCKKANDWMVGWQYCSVEPDAVIGDFAASDPAGGGTDYHGNKIFVTYQIAKNLQASLTYMRDDMNRNDYYRGDTGYNRVQADIIFKF